jgi:putative endonuclease
VGSRGIRPSPGGCRANPYLCMFYVYVLLSLLDKMLYVGSTENLKRRKQEHDQGKVESTQNRRPLKLICYECYPTKIEAQRREKYLKSSDGRKELKIRLAVSLKKYGLMEKISA